ncbi:MAG: excinuclease ABC subunit UvrC [Bacilli bacterium]|nr:excinuclease ABC subunit UvrC [Bacilli bacterium]
MNEEVKEYIKEKLKLVPELPGSYQMKNKDGLIIYVGKAKNLKRRVSSYFNKTQTGKTLMLVNDIYDFEYIVTSTELESLILEITLIKKYNPKYNILLKDDKSYPYIEFTKEKYPRLKVVRNVNRKRNKNKLYGPYPNVTAARKTVNIINRVYPLRKCENLKKDVCLYYHIGECLGYCAKEIDHDYLDKMTNEIISFLNGNSDIIKDKLKKQMEKASLDMNYERALEIRDMLNDIDITLTKQKVSLNQKYNFDVFNAYRNNNYLSIEVFFIREGLLFGRHDTIINVVDEDSEALTEYIIKFYEKNNIMPKEIIVPDYIDKDLLSEFLQIKVSSPTKGDIKKLLDLAIENARIKLEEKEETLSKSENTRLEAIEELKKILKIDKVSRMEAFDNSHLFGTFYVGGMVVFDDFLPNKDLYRKFKIDANVKDDLGAMKEVLYRRYYRVLIGEEEKCDLIIIDGGENQVNVCKKIIDEFNLDIKIIGLKKNDKHRTSSLIDEELNEIPLDRHSNLFIFLSKIQEEVHNYAISYHRQIKSKGTLSSLLDMVEGIGEKRKKELLKKFGSLKKMKEASLEELEEVLNKDIANNLYNYLKSL